MAELSWLHSASPIRMETPLTRPSAPLTAHCLTRLTRQQLADMIARADADGDGRVTLDDFYRVMTRKGFPSAPRLGETATSGREPGKIVSL